jgi:hypothetical protein
MSALLTACASAPIAVQTCPQLPPLVLEYRERNWQGEMQSFLEGSLPIPPNYNLPSNNVKLNTMPPEMR